MSKTVTNLNNFTQNVLKIKYILFDIKEKKLIPQIRDPKGSIFFHP